MSKVKVTPYRTGDTVRWISYGEERSGRVLEVQRSALIVVRLDGPLKGRLTIRMQGEGARSEREVIGHE